ncbi:MAG TPA: hypothetical protein VHH57_11735 [Gaiella sp.]|nr:hypothetical protein [Gaiella sp.]
MNEPLVLTLAGLLGDEQLETRLRNALARDVKVLALEIDGHELIIRPLDDPPDRPAGASVLLREHVWRQREGL